MYSVVFVIRYLYANLIVEFIRISSRKEVNRIINLFLFTITISSMEDNRPAKIMRRHLLPMELLDEVANWLSVNECAESDPVSANFYSFTNARAQV